MPRCAAGHDAFYLADAITVNMLVKCGYPIFYTNNYNRIHIFMPLKMLQGVYDNGFAVKLQKLLGLGASVHAMPRTPGKNQCVNQMYSHLFLIQYPHHHMIDYHMQVLRDLHIVYGYMNVVLGDFFHASSVVSGKGDTDTAVFVGVL